MDNKLKKSSKPKNDSGAVVIIEATFVFPIMFIVLFFLIFMGNGYYIRSYVDAVVAEKAYEGAAYCADPILETVKKTKTAPTGKDLHVKPYRYLFGGMDDIEKKIEGEVRDSLQSSKISLFKNMTPKIKTGSGKIAKFNNHVLYSTFSVEVECTVDLPIRMLWSTDVYTMKLRSRTETSVNDATEFIRNTDMVIDYVEKTKVGEWIQGAFEKINGFLSNFAGA